MYLGSREKLSNDMGDLNTEKKEKLREAIRENIAEFISNESNRTSLITVTRVQLSGNVEKAIIYFSILPSDKEKEALNFLKRQRGEMREYLHKKIKGGRIPFLDVEVDLGEKNRQRIDELSNSN